VPLSCVKWTWTSISPGITVRLRSSTTVAPAGAMAPFSIRVMRPFSTITVDGPRSGCDASTISRPAWIAYVSAWAVVAVSSAAAAIMILFIGIPFSGEP